ncbi:MAG: Yip1 family protein [Pseudolabrys sp.]
MNLVERIKGILLQPKSEWGAIEGEPGSAGYLIPKYVAFVAAIPAVCTFIGTSLIGSGGYRMGIGLGLARAVVVYVLSLVGVFVVAYIIDFLAGTFGARKSPDNAMRVSAYSPTAAWVAGGIKHHSGAVLPGYTRPVQPLFALHRHCRRHEAAGGQGIGLHHRRHRLRDHRVDYYFRDRGAVIRLVAPIRAMP